MPQYYFDLTDGEPIPDEHGVDLADDVAARSQAVMIMAGAVMPGSEAMSRLGDRWLIECRNARRDLVFTLEYRRVAPKG